MSSSIMEFVRSDQDPPSSSIRSDYDVFLSFRGPDTRLGIVDHLYECMIGAGLRVFKDDEEIRRGEVIGGELERAIRGSRVYAVVFSRNYASSAWCLRELNMMVDLHGGSKFGGKIILPIFYGADPTDVKLRTELYREALDGHKGRYRHDDVKKWEEALETVGRISGWDSRAIQGEGRFVRLIVQDVLGKVRMKDQSVPVNLTGIDDRVTEMLNLLDCESMGVRLVVLHGMGGIGKTTLARIVFNKLSSQFEDSSFISNVRESSTGHGGIEKLQNKLWTDILGSQNVRSYNYDDEIIGRIQGKRILLVLDDVDVLTQLKKLVGNSPEYTLGRGSRVIITTRDKEVCNGIVRSGSEVLHFYEMEKMDDNHALQLFSKHAFGTLKPPQDYLSLSKEVVETTGNLPLALAVIAGHLCCQSKETWKHTLQKLKHVPQKEIFEILRVSYDGLDWREKEIFLDIACFQQEMPRRYAGCLWEARKLYPECGVTTLINKSLIKIDSDGEFWIHDQLRDMGREIIRSEGLGRPERYARLWDRDDALKIVLQRQVSEKIIAMNFGSITEEHKLSYENFRGLHNLLYLIRLTGTHPLIGDPANIRERLMWLSWDVCNKKLDSNFFKMSNLVVLRISGVKGGWKSAVKLMMPNLRALEVWNSDMTTTPDVSHCINLEIMVYVNFNNLEEIHRSVGKLESLTYLKISNCSSLRSLPEELFGARALRELIVTGGKIEEVPESIGRLESLRTLHLRHNNIRRLPESIGRLESLRTLHLRHNNIRRLPPSICDLKNLLVLDAAYNPLDEGIPEEIGSLSVLEDLDLTKSDIPFLPAAVSRLSSLKSLKISGCEMLQELRGLPTGLTLLDASHCPLDKGLPEEIGSLSALEDLDLSWSAIRNLPAAVSRLSSLKSLKLSGCIVLRELRGLPTGLTLLDASRCPLDKGLPEEIGSLSALEDLDLSGSAIRNLPAAVSRLSSLKSLKLSGCKMLREVRGLPTSLTVLHASDLSFLGMVSVSELPSSLRMLTLRHSRTAMPWERCFNLTLLKKLEITYLTLTDIDFGGVDSLPSLKELYIKGYSLVRVSNIGRLSRGLKLLEFRGCGALVEIPGLEQLELLEGLVIWSCRSIRGIQDLLGLKRLARMAILFCSSWRGVPRMIDECVLSIEHCRALPDFRGAYREYVRRRGQQNPTGR